MILIKKIRLAEVYPLRNKILRPEQTLESCHYPEDQWPGVFHLGAYNPQQQIIAIASFYPQVLKAEPTKKSMRLRGMACDALYQGQGIGTKLLRKGIEVCQQDGADLLWCNARTEAARFYLKLGFITIGDEFEIKNIGPHFLMKKCLSAKLT